MSRDCQNTNIPKVNEDALECCELTPSKCVVMSEAVPCLQVGKGDTLDRFTKNLCKKFKKVEDKVTALEDRIAELEGIIANL